MPTPPPIKRQLPRALRDALCRRGNQASGARISLPSASVTRSTLVLTTTAVASGLNLTLEVFIPLLQEESLMLLDQPLQATKFAPVKRLRPRQFDIGEQPELSETIRFLNVNVRRFVSF